MKIIYSKYEQDDIKKRMKGLLYGVPGTYKEMILVRLIKLPFFIALLLTLIFILKEQIIEKLVFFILKEQIIEKFASFCVLFLLFPVIIGFCLFKIYIIVTSKITSFIPTPCLQKNEENKKMFEALNEINNLLDIQNDIKSFIQADNADFYFNKTDETLEIAVEKDGCWHKKKFGLNQDLCRSIEENHILDFSYLDEKIDLQPETITLQ